MREYVRKFARAYGCTGVRNFIMLRELIILLAFYWLIGKIRKNSRRYVISDENGETNVIHSYVVKCPMCVPFNMILCGISIGTETGI